MVAIDMSAAKAPPKKTTRGPGRPRATPTAVTPAQSARDRRSESLQGLAQLAQGLCIMGGKFADAATIGKYGPSLAHETANIAELSEAAYLAKGIDLLTMVTPYTAVLAIAIPFCLQLMANHGRIDPSKLSGQGIVPPDVLDAQMRANVARMQADALREQQEALRDQQLAQAEYETMMAEYDTPVATTA